jgi:hypothetical protein
MTAFFENIYKSPLLTHLNFDTLEEKKKPGDRIAFVLQKYTIGRNNPAIGSEWECFGVVEGTNGRSCRVKWDNKTTNTYDCADLVLLRDGRSQDKKNPNFLFAQIKNKREKYLPKGW